MHCHDNLQTVTTLGSKLLWVLLFTEFIKPYTLFGVLIQGTHTFKGTEESIPGTQRSTCRHAVGKAVGEGPIGLPVSILCETKGRKTPLPSSSYRCPQCSPQAPLNVTTARQKASRAQDISEFAQHLTLGSGAHRADSTRFYRCQAGAPPSLGPRSAHQAATTCFLQVSQ